MKDNSSPAFPCKKIEEQRLENTESMIAVEVTYPGISVRQYYAAKALQGIWANSSERFIKAIGKEAIGKGEERMSITYGRLALESADALLEAENEKE